MAKLYPKSWDLAGLTTENGAFEKDVPSDWIGVPGHIELDAGRHNLEWAFDEKSGGRQQDRTMFNRFLGLWRKKPEGILEFARTWGVLSTSEMRIGFARVDRRKVRGVESIEAWRMLSRRAFGVLNVAASLKLGKPGDTDDWRQFAWVQPLERSDEVDELFEKWGELGFGLGIGPDPSARNILVGKNPRRYPRLSAEAEREFWLGQYWKKIESEVIGWLEVGNVGFSVAWNRKGSAAGRWDVLVNIRGRLFAAIAIQLALAVAQADSIYPCSGCGMVYIRSRERKRPKPGQANFCHECGDPAALRAADRRRKDKMRDARILHKQGLGAAEIAQRLGVVARGGVSGAERVAGWVDKEGAAKEQRPVQSRRKDGSKTSRR